MRICLAFLALVLLLPGAAARETHRPTAMIVSPIHEAQIVRGDDGMDHVEYGLLLVSVFPEPVTLTSVAVLDATGAELLRIEGDALAAATQTLFARTPSPVVPASAAVSVDIDLVLPPDTVPASLRHRITYALAPKSELALMIGTPEIDGPDVEVDRRPALRIATPLSGDGWLATSACCAENIHRDLRVAIDGRRIETGETFAVDWVRIRGGRIHDGDGSRLEQHYAFGEPVLAVADGTVLSIRDGMPDEAPQHFMTPKQRDDYGGNHVILRIAPDVYALYAHLAPGSLAVKAGDVVKAGAPIGRIGNTGPSSGPHLHFGLSDQPDFWTGRSLPFALDSFTAAGTIDFEASAAERLVIRPDLRPLRGAYPLYGSIQNFP